MKKDTKISLEERQMILRKAARNNLLNFCEIVNDGYDVNWHHEIIANKLQENYEKLIKGISSRLIIELPVRHGKSMLATINFPAWALGKSPELPIIVASYSSDKAEDFGLQTRDIMAQNDNYRAIFSTRLRSDTKAKKKWLTQKGGGYTAVGAGGSITGKGFKIGIIDDPIKGDEEANSELIRDKIWDWYRSTFYTRQDGVAMIVAIMSRWHLDDLIGRLEEQEEQLSQAGLEYYDKWEYVTFPAIAEEDEKYRKKGEALWPKHRPLAELKKAENTLGPYNFSALYQQKPIASGKQEFKKYWFRYYDSQILRGKVLEYMTILDFGGEKEGNDESVVITIAKERSAPFWYRIEESAGIMSPDDVIDALFYHFATYKSKIWVEPNDVKALGYWIKERQRKENKYFLINELKNNAKSQKEVRIRGLIPLYASGAIYHKRDEDKAYEKQLLDFPFGKHDDRIDAMAGALEAFNSTEYENEQDVKIKEPRVDPY